MATYVITHEVDDVDAWLKSPRREEAFGKLGISIRTFRDMGDSKRVALIAEIDDLDAFNQFMQTEDAANAMRDDGVHPDTMVFHTEG